MRFNTAVADAIFTALFLRDNGRGVLVGVLRLEPLIGRYPSSAMLCPSVEVAPGHGLRSVGLGWNEELSTYMSLTFAFSRKPSR